jgi:hypothetical protein
MKRKRKKNDGEKTFRAFEFSEVPFIHGSMIDDNFGSTTYFITATLALLLPL